MQVLILYTHEMSDETTLPLLQRAGQHPLDRVRILLRCVTPSGIRMIESEGITAIVVCDTRHEGEHAMLVGKAHALAAQLRVPLHVVPFGKELSRDWVRTARPVPSVLAYLQSLVSTSAEL